MSGSSPKSISISGVETDITIGKELAAVAQKSKALASRDCFGQLEMYLHGRSHDRVCLLFGLLQTGKNTMLRQAIGRMAKEDLSRTAYIKARRTDNMAMMNRDLKKLFNAGFRYVFIDGVTLMEDFIDSAALFSDVFATMGMKIVLSGTDSLGFWLAMDEELYDRAKPIHTTFIPYREYSRLLGSDSIDEYIRYGGTLRAGELAFDDEDVNAQDASFRDDESTRRYIDTAICKNIQHSLACYESGGHFRHLYSLYEAGELTSAINRIIEDMNHRFLISVLTDDFLSHDLRLTAANLRKERDPEKRTEALDAIDTETVTRRLMELLDIRNKEEQSIGITTAHIIEIKQYLAALELIVDCPIEAADPGTEPVEHILFTQPGMRYCQAQALVHSLLKDEQFSALSEYDKTQITGRILEEVRGRMMEDMEREAPPELTAGTKRLPVDAVSFTDEITECDGKLNFYIPINFDPDAVFGTNVASAFNDDWLNVYANFGWKTGRIDSALTVCLVCSDGHEFEFFYPLTSAEQVQLWNQMDAYCHQQNGQSLGETRTALLREQAEEGLEIRL